MEHVALVVGQSLIDIVRGADGSTQEYAGGSAANVAVALARLGRTVRFATAYADDDRGRVLADHLDRAGVELAADPGAVERTSTAAATIAADGSASYDFDLEWRLNPVAEEPTPVVVHTCSLGAVLLPGAEDVLALLERLREHATITYDVNARPAITGTGEDLVVRVERMVAVCDVVKASDEDLTALYPTLPLAGAARALLDLGPVAVVVTRGADGATWFGPDGDVEVASQPVVVADTIGAGDTFWGGPGRRALGARAAGRLRAGGPAGHQCRRDRRGPDARGPGGRRHRLPARSRPAVPHRARLNRGGVRMRRLEALRTSGCADSALSARQDAPTRHRASPSSGEAGTQLALEHLEARAERELVDEPDLARVLVLAQVLPRPVDQLVSVDRLPGRGHDDGADLLAVHVVGHADHRDLRDGRVPGQHLLDLARVDVEAAPDHQVLLAVDDA